MKTTQPVPPVIKVSMRDLNKPRRTPPQKSGTISKKDDTKLGCVVGAIELYGTGHIGFLSNPREVLLHQLRPFFPVTDANLLFPAAVDSWLETPLALANRAKLKAFALL